MSYTSFNPPTQAENAVSASNMWGGTWSHPAHIDGEHLKPLSDQIEKAVNYPIRALGPLATAVWAVATKEQAPAALAAASALAVASLAVQGFADVETLGGPRPTSLFLLTAGRSGERKSSCDRQLTRSLNAHTKAQDALYVQAMKGYRTAYRRAIAEGHDEPTAPRCPTRLVTEPTYEGLVKLYAIGHPSMGLLSSEGGQFLGGHGMSKDHRQKTLTGFNSLWDGSPINRVRAEKDGIATLYDRRFCLSLMAQPDLVAAVLGDRLSQESGFLARCLVSYPQTTMGTRFINGEPDDPAVIAAIDFFNRNIDYILNTPLNLNHQTFELRPRLLTLTPEARKILIYYYNVIEGLLGQGGRYEDIAGTAAKAAEQACRIAGVLMLYHNIQATEIPHDAMQCGIDLAQHYLDEQLRLSGIQPVDGTVLAADKLRDWLMADDDDDYVKDECIIYGTMRQSAPNAIRPAKILNRAIELLTEQGFMRRLPPQTIVDGKPRAHAYALYRSARV